MMFHVDLALVVDPADRGAILITSGVGGSAPAAAPFLGGNVSVFQGAQLRALSPYVYGGTWRASTHDMPQ